MTLFQADEILKFGYGLHTEILFFVIIFTLMLMGVIVYQVLYFYIVFATRVFEIENKGTYLSTMALAYCHFPSPDWLPKSAVVRSLKRRSKDLNKI